MITKTKKLVGTALFAALALIVSLLEFPIFPAADFLKLDFSSAIILLSGFIFGPVSAVSVSAVKELLRFIFGLSSSGGVGEIANFIVCVGFVIVPSIVYKHRKGFKTVVLTIACGCIIQTVFALIANRFITFPLYMGSAAVEVFNALWYYIVFFNLIKTVAVSIITVLLYKRTSGLIKRI